ncbi:MAG TPA: hypothetical protein VFA77_04950 [Candidatus Eisenbacteria bacterium]|nr:hypothetical protein [Candidatus Eisenbacteria bacterium]
MMKRNMVGLIIIPVMGLSLASSKAQEWPVSGLYQIISGGYSACVAVCGIIGYSLPDTNQSYVELAVDEQSNTVQLAILGADRHTAFGNFGSNGCAFFLTNGVVLPDHVQFTSDYGPVSGFLSYSVSNSAGGLRIDGGFANHPIYFSHANVVAVLVAAAPIPTFSLPRVSGSGAIEFTVFNGRPGQTNVIEASTDLVKWTAISTNVFSSTNSFCPFIDFQEPASTNLVRRYYRSFSLP